MSTLVENHSSPLMIPSNQNHEDNVSIIATIKNNNNNNNIEDEDITPTLIWKKTSDSVLDELSEDESKSLQEIKQHAIAQDFPDRFIMMCLICRKFDIKRTLQLLQNNKEMRKSHGFEAWGSLPKFSEIKQSLLADFGFWLQPNLRSRDGHQIQLLQPAKLIPKNHKFNDIIDFVMWTWHFGGMAWPLEEHRKGFYIVEDLSGMSMQNVDMKVSKAVMDSFQDKIPQRMEKILIINPPMIFSALWSLCKVFMSKKMLDRFMVVKSRQELDKYVDVDQLPVEFGGKSTYTAKDFQTSFTNWAVENQL